LLVASPFLKILKADISKKIEIFFEMGWREGRRTGLRWLVYGLTRRPIGSSNRRVEPFDVDQNGLDAIPPLG